MSASCNLLSLPFPKTLTTSPYHRRPLAISSRRLLSAAGSASWSATGPIERAGPAVANPALSQANILFFRSGYNVQIVVDEDEPDEVLLRRFRREVSKAGVIQECRRRRFFENKQEEKKRKKQEAGRRNRRRRQGPRFNAASAQASAQADADAAKKSKEDDDDNWDLPDGGLPF